jgi:hypothetical protein
MTTPQHHRAATDIDIVRVSMHPREIFREGDRIQVHGTQTKHHGRIARIGSIGNRRLSVVFEDGLAGKYVDYTDVVLIPERGQTRHVQTPTRLQSSTPWNQRTSGTRAAMEQRRHNSPGPNRQQRRATYGSPEMGITDTNSIRAYDVDNNSLSDRRSINHQINRAISDDRLDRAWRRAAEDDDSDQQEHSDDEYSILDNNETGRTELAVPTDPKAIATHRVLDQFSITAATLITQHSDNNTEMERLMQLFFRQVRLDVDTLTSNQTQA